MSKRRVPMNKGRVLMLKQPSATKATFRIEQGRFTENRGNKTFNEITHYYYFLILVTHINIVALHIA